MKKRISYVIFLVSLLTLLFYVAVIKVQSLRRKSRKKQRIRNRLRKKRQTGKRTIR